MSVAEIKEQISQLPSTERARLAMWLWESVDESQIESPAWHAEELKRREEEIASGKAKFIPWEQAKDEIRRRTS